MNVPNPVMLGTFTTPTASPNLVGPFLRTEHLRWQIQAQNRQFVATGVTLGHSGGEATATTQVQLAQDWLQLVGGWTKPSETY